MVKVSNARTEEKRNYNVKILDKSFLFRRPEPLRSCATCKKNLRSHRFQQAKEATLEYSEPTKICKLFSQ